MKSILIVLIMTTSFVFGQNNHLKMFEKLMNRTWEAEGKWGDGSVFKQEINYKYALDSTLIISSSKGFTDKAQKKYGNRNHGIRKYNASKKQIEFWEFDVFGGLTEGTVTYEDKNILYEYEYGGTIVTEVWKFVNDSTYTFKVGTYKDGAWNQVFLDTQFKGSKTFSIDKVYAKLKKELVGSWRSKAWDGELKEKWYQDQNGNLSNQAQYVEKGEVRYEATNRIEVVKNEMILFTIIKDGNPKIYKASSYTENSIVFENSDYKNPNKVIYTFGDTDGFQRSISGTENNKPSSYTFKFVKIK